ncbi:uncharacterized protein [Prorops nasuta]|uniref:uncharacterized protein n=1 Tax=Prorops nasuta TaxID=863751 RepID=UPI0034CF7800
MPRIPGDENQREAIKLDEEFKQILSCIKSSLSVLEASDIQLSKAWLVKLNESKQRKLRNEYLLEFYYQLKSGQISGIFSKPPANGLLFPLRKSFNATNTHSSSDVESSPQIQKVCSKSNAFLHQDLFYKPTQKCCEINSASNTGSNSSTIDSYINDETNLNQGKTCKEQIDTLISVIRELQEQNEKLGLDLFHAKEKYSLHELKLQTNIENLISENESLKTNLAEMKKGKELLEKNMEKLKSLGQQYEFVIRKKNEELEAKDNCIIQKDKEISQKESRKSEELDNLKKQIEELEHKLLQETKNVIIEKIMPYSSQEGKIHAMVNDHYKKMKEEMDKMREDMNVSVQNQDLMSKVNMLRRALDRLEKSKEKLEQDCKNTICQTIQSKDQEIKVLNLKLQRQRNELLACISSEKQADFDKLIVQLEERYKNLLNKAESAANVQQQYYLQVIYIIINILIHSN